MKTVLFVLAVILCVCIIPSVEAEEFPKVWNVETEIATCEWDVWTIDASMMGIDIKWYNVGVGKAWTAIALWTSDEGWSKMDSRHMSDWCNHYAFGGKDVLRGWLTWARPNRIVLSDQTIEEMWISSR